jgi:hypothetical protein
VHHAAETSLHAAQSALADLIANFPNPAVRLLLRVALMPFGITCAKPSDVLTQAAAAAISEPTATRDRLTSGIFAPRDSELGKLDQAFRLMSELEPLRQEMRRARVRTAEDAVAKGILSDNEAERMREALALVRDVSSVDDFAPEELLPQRGAVARSAAA